MYCRTFFKSIIVIQDQFMNIHMNDKNWGKWHYLFNKKRVELSQPVMGVLQLMNYIKFNPSFNMLWGHVTIAGGIFVIVKASPWLCKEQSVVISEPL